VSIFFFWVSGAPDAVIMKIIRIHIFSKEMHRDIADFNKVKKSVSSYKE